MKFSHVTITVKNLEESLRFYQDIIGLLLINRFSPKPGLEIAFLKNGETAIELVHNQVHTDIFVGQNISLGFAVESVQETINFLKEKGIDTGEVLSPTPQAKFFFVSDPNGVKVQFAEWVK